MNSVGKWLSDISINGATSSSLAKNQLDQRAENLYCESEIDKINNQYILNYALYLVHYRGVNERKDSSIDYGDFLVAYIKLLHTYTIYYIRS